MTAEVYRLRQGHILAEQFILASPPWPDNVYEVDLGPPIGIIHVLYVPGKILKVIKDGEWILVTGFGDVTIMPNFQFVDLYINDNPTAELLNDIAELQAEVAVLETKITDALVILNGGDPPLTKIADSIIVLEA